MIYTTSHELAGILRAILEDPFDLTPRLVYADWLEEFGTHEADRMRAEFIRTGKMPATCPRASWIGTLGLMRDVQTIPGGIMGSPGIRGTPLFRCGWDRGFVHHIECELPALLEHRKAVFAEHPVTRVKLVADIREREQRLLMPVTVDTASMADGTVEYLCRWDHITLAHAGQFHGSPISARFADDLAALREHLCTMADYSLMPADQACVMVDTLVANWCREQVGLPALPLP